MNILHYFHTALANNFNPLLLEFTTWQKKSLTVCGIRPRTILYVKNNTLFKNGEAIGCGLDIFKHLQVGNSSAFLPAWLGFFSYEFAEYFGSSTNTGDRHFPDAFFAFYEEGLVIHDGRVEHHDSLASSALFLPSIFEKTLTPFMNKNQFFTIVNDIKERIHKGDVYQVNFSIPFSFTSTDEEMLAIYTAMRRYNPSPFMGLVHHDDWWVASGSPERLFSCHKGSITTRPIAGTKKRGDNEKTDNDHILELTHCPKENAEHAMLVDLLRNDMNQVSYPHSVFVNEDRSIEFYSHVMHLVSEICGVSDKNLKEIMRAFFPGGTITGAPKSTVMRAIAELETKPRGPYTGSLGYISSGYGVDFNILIRSVFKHGNNACINAGAGIVIDSNPETEWEEINKKAQSVKAILEHRAEPKKLRETIKGPRLKCEFSQNMVSKNIYFAENHDSFSFNIIAALRTLGCTVTVGTPKDFTLDNFSHVILGPGPGNPSDMPELLSLIKKVTDVKIPVLGICLGHQAIGHVFGANIVRATPVHGKSETIPHFGQGLFFSLASPSTFTRYHSLVIDKAPSDFIVDAYANDLIMAIRHKYLPIYGVQFHPESYLSKDGLKLLYNFVVS